MESIKLLRAILPEVLIDNFDVVKFNKTSTRFDIYLDEKKVMMREDKRNSHVISHVSRHSFATSVCLSNGVPIETVSSMLGHKDIKTTQVYAKITKEKLSKDVEKLSQQINNIEEFTFGNVCNDNTNTINGRA